MNVIFEDHSKEVKEAFEAAVLEALGNLGEAAEGHAKAIAPVDTGNLRDHIRHAVAEDESAIYIGTTKEEVPYAAYVELGTHKAKAQPFLKPAVANHSGEYRKIIEDAFK